MRPPRPPMPERVKRAAIVLNMSGTGILKCAELGIVLEVEDVLKGELRFDHNPPLGLRAVEGGKYKPDANDARFIDVCSQPGHDIRTNTKRGLYHGDQTQIAKVERIEKRRTQPKGDGAPKQKIKSRGFQTQSRRKWKQPVRGPTVRRHT